MVVITFLLHQAACCLDFMRMKIDIKKYVKSDFHSHLSPIADTIFHFIKVPAKTSLQGIKSYFKNNTEVCHISGLFKAAIL